MGCAVVLVNATNHSERRACFCLWWRSKKLWRRWANSSRTSMSSTQLTIILFDSIWTFCTVAIPTFLWSSQIISILRRCSTWCVDKTLRAGALDTCVYLAILCATRVSCVCLELARAGFMVSWLLPEMVMRHVLWMEGTCLVAPRNNLKRGLLCMTGFTISTQLLVKHFLTQIIHHPTSVRDMESSNLMMKTWTDQSWDTCHQGSS